jgi:hypothetical protein
MWSKAKRRRGAVLVLLAICLTAMLGIVALAVDAGLIMDQRRRIQSAADAAALAAAADLYLNKANNATADATFIAQSNGYSNVQVNIPPASGNYAGKAGYAEVKIQFNQPRGFSAIFGSSTILIQARAVAQGQLASIGDGIILVDPTGNGALTAAGNAAMNVTNGSIIVDSNSASGGVTNGNHATVTAPQMDFTGNPGYSGNFNMPNHAGISSSQTPTPDPLSYVKEPNPGALGLTTQSQHQLNIQGQATLNPGVYIGGINISSVHANVTMNSGPTPIYYMQGGGFSAQGGTTTGNGVMIFNDNGGGSISITGQASVTLSPPINMTGAQAVYNGISLFQSRSNANLINVAGKGSTNITGTFYAVAPGTALQVAGNGDNLASQIITWDLKVAGNGTVNVPYSGNLSGKTRQYGFVE